MLGEKGLRMFLARLVLAWYSLLKQYQEKKNVTVSLSLEKVPPVTQVALICYLTSF